MECKIEIISYKEEKQPIFSPDGISILREDLDINSVILINGFEATIYATVNGNLIEEFYSEEYDFDDQEEKNILSIFKNISRNKDIFNRKSHP